MSPISQQLMFAQALSAVIETLFNQALVYNLNGTRSLIPLNEKTLTVKLAELGFPLNFSVNNEKIHITSGSVESDCTITSSIKTLLALKDQQKLTDLIKQDKLDIDGDIKIAQQFSALAESIDIDWQKLSFALQQIQADASEWLVHEKNLMVTNSELSTFYSHVDHVTTQVEQVAQRIDHLTALIKP